MKPVLASQGLLFVSFLFRSDLHAEKDLKFFFEEKFGKGFFFAPKVNPLAAYYAQEMGGVDRLRRIFCLTSSLFPREFLLSTKLQALNWEECWATERKRTVNVDVGFLTLENFLLATTKNFSHRIYLGQSIFGDLTYYFHQGRLQTLPWTYPDYVDEEKKNFFLWCRGHLLQELQG